MSTGKPRGVEEREPSEKMEDVGVLGFEVRELETSPQKARRAAEQEGR